MPAAVLVVAMLVSGAMAGEALACLNTWGHIAGVARGAACKCDGVSREVACAQFFAGLKI